MPNINEFTRLPAPPAPPPQASGHVVLFRDNKWTSQKMVLSLDDYLKGVRHSMGGSPLQDATTWVAFNLPVGTVMTLMQDVKEVDTAKGQQCWDLRNCGNCVDLVGTGNTEGVDLTKCNMNDCISAFFWRDVDLDLGAIELFGDVDFRGNRTTIFLSEWPPGRTHELGGWWLNDKISSVRWTTLHDRQMVSLFEHSNGSGRRYENVFGWSSKKEIARLSDVSFNDCISSFSWQALAPKKEIFTNIVLRPNISEGSELPGLYSSKTGTNLTSETQIDKISLKDETAQEITITLEEKYTTGYKVSYEVGADTLGKDKKLNIGIERTGEKKGAMENKTSMNMSLSIENEIKVPPRSSYEATLTVQMIKLQGVPFQTTAERWYDVSLTGTVPDPANNGWYKRVETVNGIIDAALGCNTNFFVKADPIP